jgi:hypothetical protein
VRSSQTTCSFSQPDMGVAALQGPATKWFQEHSMPARMCWSQQPAVLSSWQDVAGYKRVITKICQLI